jgi:hypothetical protein
MQNKKNTISYIKKLIKENGSFSISEFDGVACLPAVNEMGKLVALAEHFYEDKVEVNIYEPNSFSSDPISEPYYLPYEELSLELLAEIEELCDYKDAENFKTQKRISN